MNGTELSVPERVSLALNTEAVKAEFLKLAAESKAITEIRDDASYAECHNARMRLVKARTATAKRGKDAREDAQAFSKGVIAAEKMLLEIITPEEKRLQAIQDAHDALIEAERKAKAEAEEERLNGIKYQLITIADIPARATGLSSEKMGFVLAEWKAHDVTKWAQEFTPQAEEAKAKAIAALELMLAGTVAKEQAEKAEADRIAAEKADFERRQKELAERERAEAARIAQEAQERAKAEAEAKARLAAEEAASRARIQAAEAEAKKEADRLAAERHAAEDRERIRREESEKLLREQQERERRERDEADAKAKEQARAQEKATTGADVSAGRSVTAPAAAHTDDHARGLYNKFHVARMDGSTKHHGCEYFVLDLNHDRHAIAALFAYADSCHAEYPALAQDLRAKAVKLNERKAA